MKRKDEITRLKDMEGAELKEEIDRLKESLFRLRFKLALGEREVVNSIRRERKSLARVQTLLRQQ